MQSSIIYKPNRAQVALAWLVFGLGATVFIIHFLYFRYSFTHSNIDEVSFFSPAANLARGQSFASSVHTGFLPGASEYTYWMPPAYMVLLGVYLKISVVSVLNAKLMSMLCIVVAAFCLSLLSKNRVTKLWMAGLVLLCPFVLISSSFIRMEAMAVMISAIALLGVQRQWRSFWLGVIAAVGVMTHPMMLACAGGLFLATFTRKRFAFLYFTAGFLVCIAPYLIYIARDPDLFVAQMSLQFARKSEATLAKLHLSYLFQSATMALPAIYFSWKLRNLPLKVFLVSATLAALILVLRSNEYNYHVYLAPFAIGAAGLYMDEQKGRSRLALLFPAALFVFFLAVLYLKWNKYKANSDRSFVELANFLQNSSGWQNTTTYVSGDPDVSIYLVEKAQDVRRMNAVANYESAAWPSAFFCFVKVKDNRKNEPDYNAIPVDGSWKLVNQFTTTDGSYSMQIYTR